MVHFTAVIEQFAEKGEKTGWSYIAVPAELAAQLKPGFRKSFRVKGKLDNHPVRQLALIPMGNGDFILALKASLRKVIHKNKGAVVAVSLQEDTKPLEVSKELLECLHDSPAAEKKFLAFPLSHQMYYSNWIGSAKGAATRANRIMSAILGLERNLNFSEILKLNAQSVNK